MTRLAVGVVLFGLLCSPAIAGEADPRDCGDWVEQDNIARRFPDTAYLPHAVEDELILVES